MMNEFATKKRPTLLVPALLLAVAAIFFGGASRLDVAAPLVVRIVAVICLVWCVGRTPLDQWRIGWTPALLWICILSVPLIQLVPLPWSIWSTLPGRSYAASVYRHLGEEPSHALSLTPDRTINALSAILPALAAYFIGVRLNRAAQVILFATLAVLALASASLGLAQAISGPDSAAYLYVITNNDSSVGFFANANHHALFLCSGIVATLLVADELVTSRPYLRWGIIGSAALTIGVMFLSILATKSRAGAGLAIIGLLGGLMAGRISIFKLSRRANALLLVILAGALLGVLALAYTGSLFGHDLEIDEFSNQRLNDLPTFVQMIRDFLPFGSGLGSFEPLFQSYETAATFSYQYLNNAHNDYAQILIETGVLGGALLLAFLVWWGRAFTKAWSDIGRSAAAIGSSNLKRTAALITLLMLLHSTVDYPLRTAALSTVFAYCIAIMSAADPQDPDGRPRHRSNWIVSRWKASRKITYDGHPHSGDGG